MTVARRISDDKERARKGLPPRLPMTPERRREWGSRGGSLRTTPGYYLDKLMTALPGLTEQERDRLIALADAARDQEPGHGTA
jgi:hypothetical protein